MDEYWSDSDPEIPIPAQPAPAPAGDAFLPDHRLYLPDNEGWTARVHTSWDRFYCYGKRPGEDFHHLIMHGELYLLNQHEEVYCLECGVRTGILTRNRLFWQKRGPRERDG